MLTVEPERRTSLAQQAVQEARGVGQVREAVWSQRARAVRHQPAAESRRPPGFTRMLREMRGVLRRIVPQDLTESDMRELRLLFTDLAFLARGDPRKRKTVFPPLPVLPQRRRTRARLRL